MYKSFTVFLLVIIISLLVGLYAVERMVVRFENPNNDMLKEFIKPGYDIASYRPGEYLDLVVTFSELSILNEKGFFPVITQTEESLKYNLSTQSETNKDSPRITGYRSYNDLVLELNNLSEQFPDLVRIYNLGESLGKSYYEAGNNNYQGYNFNIWALKLTTNPDLEMDKPAVMYMGGHHAREPISVEVTMTVLNYLLDNYETDEEINFLINETEIWFVPLVNPDGHRVVYSQNDVWWRKNIRDNNENGVFDTNNNWGYGADGVDLNRNYPFEWEGSPNPTHPTYPGPDAASEPEINLIMTLLEQRHFVAAISYHSYSELVLFPYGYNYEATAPDHNALSSLAVNMAYTIPRLSGNGYYTPQQSIELYPAKGVTDDFAYGQLGIFSYTFELGVEFIPSPPHIDQICQDNIEAALVLLRRVHKSTLTGIITDEFSGEPIEAEIFISGIDDTGAFREPYKSSEQFGRYYRLLLPGEYTVTYSAYEYEPVTLQNIVITEDSQTIQSIALRPTGIGQLEGTVIDFYTQLPIEGANIKILQSPLETAISNEEGSFSFPAIPLGTYEIEISALGYGTHFDEILISDENNSYNIELFTPYFTDTFDDTANWDLSGDWGLSDYHSYIGEFSLSDNAVGGYQSEMSSYAQLSSPLDLSNVYNGSITFYAKYDLEFNYDFCYLEISLDNNEWETIHTFNGLSDWSFYEFSLRNYLGNHLYLRFLFSSDHSIEKEGFYLDNFSLFLSAPDLVSIDKNSPITPTLFNYPNPFNPSTTISFFSENEAEISLKIYNIKGQLVASLLKDRLMQGVHNIVWNGKDNNNKPVASGIYYSYLEINNQTQTRKMLLLK